MPDALNKPEITWRVHSQTTEGWWRWCRWQEEWTGRGWPAAWPCRSYWSQKPWRLFPAAHYSTSRPNTAGTWTRGAGGRSGQADRGRRKHPSWRKGLGKHCVENRLKVLLFITNWFPIVAFQCCRLWMCLKTWKLTMCLICLLNKTTASLLPYHSLIEDQAQDIPTDIKLRVWRL